MKFLANLLAALLIAHWIGTIAIFSIQNITEVSLKFLTFESISLPVGVLLSFCVGIGLVIGVIAFGGAGLSR
jgi:putative membrane protein